MGGRCCRIQVKSLSQFRFYWLSDWFSISRPERWANIPDAATSVRGVWGNLLTFSGGIRACIGYRFSVVE